jgi:protein-tyrosine phosphatase
LSEEDPVTEVVERLIALEGAVNFRDLGGYAVGGGERTRWRTLFRADGLGELTGADLEVLRALGIRTVIDLRSGEELERGRFDVDAHPVAFHHFPFIRELPDAEEFDRRPGLLGAQYQEIVGGAGPQILAALEVLASPEALPAVFHCTAGKDRTGVLSAIVLSLLGVDEETVVADYALSGEAMRRLRAKLILKYPEGRETIENIDEVFSADPAQMRQLLTHVRAEYGSVEAYVAGLGGDANLVTSLRDALLEPAGS